MESGKQKAMKIIGKEEKRSLVKRKFHSFFFQVFIKEVVDYIVYRLCLILVEIIIILDKSLLSWGESKSVFLFQMISFEVERTIRAFHIESTHKQANIFVTTSGALKSNKL